MGKPKALRNRDVVPAIVKEQSSRKRTTFDSEESAVDSSNSVDHDVNSTVDIESSKVSDEPEEVTAQSMEVIRMKEMHEKIVDSTLKKSKRRKVSVTKGTGQNADVALDASIFDSLAQDEEESEGEEDGSDDDETPGWKIDVKRSNSRKIGGIEVTVLDKAEELDPIKSFNVSESVKNFSATAYNKNARVKYMSFVTQKKGGPSKQFAVK